MAAMPIRIMLVDDHALIRQGMRLLLTQDPELEVVGEARNGLEALARVEQLKPDVVLMDLLMPEMDGITAIGKLKESFPEIEIIALTSVLEDASVVAAVKAGAIGYLLKDMQARELQEAIKAASEGRVQLAPEAAARLMRELRPSTDAPVLTEREHDVLELVAEGHSNQVIADRLVIGEKTVKTHVSRLLSKLGVKSRTQLAVQVWQKSPGVARKSH
jgi:DNA-binding NarL/FixJ family response regulator